MGMKIAQVMLARGYGGAERIFVDTCLSLADYHHEVLALVDRDFYGLPLLRHQPGLTVAPIRILSRYDPWARYQLGRHLRAFQPDIIHFHLRRSLVMAATAGRRLGVPLVATVHNDNQPLAYTAADHLIALTAGQANDLQNYPALAGKVTVIANFSRFAATIATIPQTGPIKYLAYGRFAPKKGFDVLLSAFAAARQHLSNAHLTLAGAGALATALQQQITNLGLNQQVTLLGWTDQVLDLLDQHDVFILPSREEAFGVVVLEAMARHKVIIATRCNGPRQFLTEQSAYFCEPGDVASLAKQLIQVDQQRLEAQQKAKQANQDYRAYYQMEQVIPRLCAFYEDF